MEEHTHWYGTGTPIRFQIWSETIILQMKTTIFITQRYRPLFTWIKEGFFEAR